MADNDNKPVDTVRMYTRARKFPLLIGRFPDGKQVPGGPYTLPQLVGGVVALAALWFLRPIWAHFGAIMNLALAALITAGVVWGLGRLPQTGRSPWSRLGGLGKAASRSPKARVNGRTITIRRPHTVLGTVTVADGRHRTPALAPPPQGSQDQNSVTEDSSPEGSTPPAPAGSGRRPETNTRSQERRTSRSSSTNGRRRRATSPPPAAAPPWAPAPAAHAASPDTELSPASAIYRPAAVPRHELGVDPAPSHAAAHGEPPRVRAAAGTGVAQLLALAADAQRKQ